MATGALGPIANLVGFTTAGLGGASRGTASSTPPIDNFFGLDGRLLRSPAGGTALFNNILFGASNQQVPIDFLAGGFYTGIPPIFGGTGFTGMAPRFDFFANAQPGLFGVDLLLALERSVNGTSGTGGTAKAEAKPKEPEKKKDESISLASLKQMSLGQILKLIS